MFDFFQSRRVLVTGHTGFKGSWLCAWLLKKGARVSGFSLNVPTKPSLFELLGLQQDLRHHQGDIRDPQAVWRLLQQEQPEIIFHLAAQSLVRRSIVAPKETFDTNVAGVVHLLDAVRKTPAVRAVIVVTSDKCYAESAAGLAHEENDPLGGRDPYSASKACAELVVNAYRESLLQPGQGAALATVRAGNVIGGGDWAEDRLVPDCIRSLVLRQPIALRRPEAIRPWQHVLEPLAGYLMLACRLAEEPDAHSGAWNFGPEPESCCSAGELAELLVRSWGSGTWLSRPDPRADLETGCLRLSSQKARLVLGWKPTWSLAATVKRTSDWYRAYYAQPSATMKELTGRQIDEHETALIRPVLATPVISCCT